MPLPAGGHTALVAEAVTVRNFAGQHIGDGFNSPVGMPGKSGHVIRRVITTKIVQQQERIELPRPAESEGALQLYARSLDGGLGFRHLLHCAKRHGRPPLPCTCSMRARDICCNM
jgi:hypothetical protein